MTTKDPYLILGISQNASQDEIKNAYRMLAKKYHPDLNPGNKDAESKFKDITFAYEQIGSPENRARFNQAGFSQFSSGEGHFNGSGDGRRGTAGRGPFYRNTQESRQGGGRYTYSFGKGLDEELLKNIFDRMEQPGAQRFGESENNAKNFVFPGEDYFYQLTIDLKDSVLGAEKEIVLPSGGKLRMKVPAGISDGARLRLSGKGAPGINGGPSGDAYVEIHVRNDARFKREGDNLISELPISIIEAVFGGEVRFSTIEGDVMLKIPPKSNTGHRLKLSGKGISNPHTHRRGDQVVVLKVMLPEVIDPELEAALRTWKLKHAYNPRRREAA